MANPAIRTDAVIIGAGPVGLFAVFELGLLGLEAHVIDVLDRPGGQCAELYPDKPIYDIPAVPVCTGRELTENLLKQIRPFNPVFHFRQSALTLEPGEAGRWRLVTDTGTTFDAAAIVIAAGGGRFVPRKPPLPGLAAYEGTSVFYAVPDVELFRGRRVLIAGGGDSALDWTVHLHGIASRVTLLHRRREFRAAPHSIAKMLELAETGKIEFVAGELKALHGSEGKLEAASVRTVEGELQLRCDALLAFFGLTMHLGPIANFGLDLVGDRISVDTQKFETRRRGVFAVGDINYYPGKLKLILSGFHEAALMAQQAFRYARPDEKLVFQYTTTSKKLHERLRVG